jgi:predicted enzyme related to lactoylglutathione lyase
MPPEVLGLAGVLFWTSDERHPAMRAFYAETLGIRPRSDRSGFVNFQLGEARLTVAVHEEVNGPARDPLRIMVNLSVDGLDEMHRQLMAKGVPCLRPPEPESWGGRVATYTDPDGNVVQLFELPDSYSDGG